jgi:hypothetical protein
VAGLEPVPTLLAKQTGKNTKVLQWCRLHGKSTKFLLSNCPEVVPSSGLGRHQRDIPSEFAGMASRYGAHASKQAAHLAVIDPTDAVLRLPFLWSQQETTLLENTPLVWRLGHLGDGS